MTVLRHLGRAVRYPVRMARSLGQWARWWRNPAGHFLTHPPGHYYSPLPDTAAIGPAVARAAAVGDHLPGLDLNPEGQLALLRELAPLASQWPFPDTPATGYRYHANNGFFYHQDGSVLYALLRHRPPARVVEVGSGFSSALMLDTADRQPDIPTQFTFIDPYPDRLLGLLSPADRERCAVLARPVQEVDLGVFGRLQAGDVLFIDSSHVCKLGSDLNHLVFEVLPTLSPGVLVHVHDVNWPFEYSEGWLRAGHAWNEAYLLRAFLLGNRDFRFLLWTSYLEARRPEEFRRLWPYPSVPGGPAHVSLWLERVG